MGKRCSTVKTAWELSPSPKSWNSTYERQSQVKLTGLVPVLSFLSTCAKTGVASHDDAKSSGTAIKMVVCFVVCPCFVVLVCRVSLFMVERLTNRQSCNQVRWSRLSGDLHRPRRSGECRNYGPSNQSTCSSSTQTRNQRWQTQYRFHCR